MKSKRLGRPRVENPMTKFIRLDENTKHALEILKTKLGLRDIRSVINLLLLRDSRIVKALIDLGLDPYTQLTIIRNIESMKDPTTQALLEIHSKRYDKTKREKEIIEDTLTSLEERKRLKGKEIYDRLRELEEQDRQLKLKLQRQREYNDMVASLMLEFGLSEYEAKRIMELSESERKKVLSKLRR